MQRRLLFKIALGGLLVPSASPVPSRPSPAPTAVVPVAESHVLLRFGYVADVHYSDRADRTKPERGTVRAYRDSLGKLRNAVQRFNVQGVDFAVELGDFKDVDAAATREGTLRCLQEAEAVFSEFNGPRYHVVGNHDCDLITLSDFLENTENAPGAQGRNYYSFTAGGVKCIVLDACYNDASGSHYSPGRSNWKIAVVADDELAWLEQELSSGTEPVLVFLHQLLNYWDAGTAFKRRFVVRNARQVVSLLEASGRVLAVFSGHYHRGFFSERNGIPYVVARAMVSNPPPRTAGGIVTLDDQWTLCVEGFGDEPSHVRRKA